MPASDLCGRESLVCTCTYPQKCVHHLLLLLLSWQSAKKHFRALLFFSASKDDDDVCVDDGLSFFYNIKNLYVAELQSLNTSKKSCTILVE